MNLDDNVKALEFRADFFRFNSVKAIFQNRGLHFLAVLRYDAISSNFFPLKSTQTDAMLRCTFFSIRHLVPGTVLTFEHSFKHEQCVINIRTHVHTNCTVHIIILFCFGKSYLQIFRRFPSKVKSIVKVLAPCAIFFSHFGKPSLFFLSLSISHCLSSALLVYIASIKYRIHFWGFWVVHSHPVCQMFMYFYQIKLEILHFLLLLALLLSNLFTVK